MPEIRKIQISVRIQISVAAGFSVGWLRISATSQRLRNRADRYETAFSPNSCMIFVEMAMYVRKDCVPSVTRCADRIKLSGELRPPSDDSPAEQAFDEDADFYHSLLDGDAFRIGPHPLDAWELPHEPLITTLSDMADTWDNAIKAGRTKAQLLGCCPHRAWPGLYGPVIRKGCAPVEVLLQYTMDST
jgi:hypothetical protein